jgi:hypothetical protein
MLYPHLIYCHEIPCVQKSNMTLQVLYLTTHFLILSRVTVSKTRVWIGESV